MYKDGQQLLQFLQNHYLSTELGQKLMGAVLGDNKDHHASYKKQIDAHNEIMNQIFPPQALNDDQPLMPVTPPQQLVPGAPQQVALDDDHPFMPQAHIQNIPPKPGSNNVA